MAKQPIKQNGHRLDVRLPADLMRRVEAYAARNKLDRSTAVRELLEWGLRGEVYRPMLVGLQ
jgi:metal-responsive CopG/Arc/MetJ family transcriptional regulator